jgi:hypothetical protein
MASLANGCTDVSHEGVVMAARKVRKTSRMAKPPNLTPALGKSIGVAFTELENAVKRIDKDFKDLRKKLVAYDCICIMRGSK